jgi:hypothetical protein
MPLDGEQFDLVVCTLALGQLSDLSTSRRWPRRALP